MALVSPDDVTRLTRPTDGFLCPLSANIYGLDFQQFTISDYETKKIIFQIGRDFPMPTDVAIDMVGVGEDMYRRIKYTFSEDVLRLPFIQTSLVFSTGDREVRDFRMIERHYFRDQLVKSFDFKFGFCIPGSTNNWDAVYSLPPLSESLITDMINSPFLTKSDSFYFVDGRLVMHNKASYSYVREDAAQAKKSYEEKFASKGYKTAKAAKAAEKNERDLTSMTADMKIADAKVSAPGTPGRAAKAASKVEWSKDSDYN